MKKVKINLGSNEEHDETYYDGYQAGYAAAEEEQKKKVAEWRQSWNYNECVECSNCRFELHKKLISYYCPHCGYDMRESNNDWENYFSTKDINTRFDEVREDYKRG